MIPSFLRGLIRIGTALVMTAGLCWADEPFSVDILRPQHGSQKVRIFHSAEEMHAQYTHDFASRPGFGKSRIVFLPPQDFLSQDGLRYHFKTPVLLGLEGEPMAYVSQGPPLTADDVASRALRSRWVQKRALSEPERQAATRLKAGADLVMSAQDIEVVSPGVTNRVMGLLVVGALRVQSACAACHQKPEGTLLGAFAYSLVPESGGPEGKRGRGPDLASSSCR